MQCSAIAHSPDTALDVHYFLPTRRYSNRRKIPSPTLFGSATPRALFSNVTLRTQEAYIDFAQITATGSGSPTPSPTDEPTAPVTAPVAAPTPEPVAPVAAPQPAAAPQPVVSGSGSNVIGVFMVSGQEVEEGQDEESLQVSGWSILAVGCGCWVFRCKGKLPMSV